ERVDQGKNGRVGAHAERQRENGGRRKGGGASPDPKAVSQVLPERIHGDLELLLLWIRLNNAPRSIAPPPYNLGQRQDASEETRRRIVAAARDLLADESGPPGFTVETVARRAGVARMTVYYQFRSKRGVLEALFDDLANRGLMPHLR